MAIAEKTMITVEATIKAPIEKVWECFTEPKHVTKWNFAHESWECPNAQNDLQVGGKFSYNMAAKDGSFAFDFGGVYDEIILHKVISNILDDGRKMRVTFTVNGNEVLVSESFEAEKENPVEMQRAGWQAILDNFKIYTEKL